MKLIQLDINNFRLLDSASVSLDGAGATTVFVGPNNSGKTSMAEALDLFVTGRGKLSVSDFSLTSYALFAAFEAACLGRIDAIAKAEAEKSAAPEPDALPPLPTMSLALHFEYEDDPADFVVIENVINSFDPARTVAVLVEYAASDPEALAAEFVKRRAHEKIGFLQFLAEGLAGHFDLSVYKFARATAKKGSAIDRSLLGRLLKVDFLPAQRHMEDQESGAQATKLSRLLNSHYERRHKYDDPEGYEELERVVRAQSASLTGKYEAAFDEFRGSLSQFGYPKTPNLKIRAELTASAIFKDNTRVYYSAEVEALAGAAPIAYDLPERYNGLGFKNLIYMVLQLKAFRDELQVIDGPRPRAHLIIVEEPEAHLHPQMQTVFMEKAGKFINAGATDGSQLVVTTHSAHIVASCGFSPIRYFRRRGARAVIKDLMSFQAGQTSPDQKIAIDFLSRYLTLTRCDLFFCDKAILIEGAVERLLLPKMIALAAEGGAGDLTSTYLAIIEVGGAYAHAFKDLVAFIEVPTLVVTDLDSVGEDRKKCRVADGKKTSNAALKKWLPKQAVVADLLAAKDADKIANGVRVAYQIPETAGSPCARSFEESFIYANADWLLVNRDKLMGTGSHLVGATAQALIASAYDFELPKVDFALDLILNPGWKAPRYIAEGLLWLSEQAA